MPVYADSFQLTVPYPSMSENAWAALTCWSVSSTISMKIWAPLRGTSPVVDGPRHDLYGVALGRDRRPAGSDRLFWTPTRCRADPCTRFRQGGVGAVPHWVDAIT